MLNNYAALVIWVRSVRNLPPRLVVQETMNHGPRARYAAETSDEEQDPAAGNKHPNNGARKGVSGRLARGRKALAVATAPARQLEGSCRLRAARSSEYAA